MSEQTIFNNRYQVQESLGTGGMAMVYKAHDLTLDRTVAVKVLRKDFSNDPDFRKRFHQEAKAAARLSHPNIVTVHDFGLFADQIFIVMEYVPGTDLKALLKQHGKLGIADALDLIIQASSGIGYAHRSGLVHCDIKPQNLLVTPDRRVKVLDFGIARALTSISPDERSEIVWGSPQYFSPEQAAGGAPSPASDVYSLGVVLFELLTGRLPFIANTAEELARLHREALPPSPRRSNPAIPVALEQILLKVLSKEPAARYRTADQLGRVLTSYLQSQPINGQAAVYPTSPVEPAHPATVPPAAVEDASAGRRLSSGGRKLSNSQPTGRTPDGSQPVRRPVGGNSQPVSPQPSATILAGGNLAARPYPQEAVIIEEEPPPEVVVISSRADEYGFDLVTWLLAVLAVIALGGLIPFWWWVLSRLPG